MVPRDAEVFRQLAVRPGRSFELEHDLMSPLFRSMCDPELPFDSCTPTFENRTETGERLRIRGIPPIAANASAATAIISKRKNRNMNIVLLSS